MFISVQLARRRYRSTPGDTFFRGGRYRTDTGDTFCDDGRYRGNTGDTFLHDGRYRGNTGDTFRHRGRDCEDLGDTFLACLVQELPISGNSVWQDVRFWRCGGGNMRKNIKKREVNFVLQN